MNNKQIEISYAESRKSTYLISASLLAQKTETKLILTTTLGVIMCDGIVGQEECGDDIVFQKFINLANQKDDYPAATTHVDTNLRYILKNPSIIGSGKTINLPYLLVFSEGILGISVGKQSK